MPSMVGTGNFGNIEKMLAHLPGVRAAVAEVNLGIWVKAVMAFAPHDKGGGHRIIKKTYSTDSWTYLEGPHASALEFGHVSKGKFAAKSGWVDGIHVLSGAAPKNV